MKKILIIGNGFDIYHGLPTRYNDFLFLAEKWKEFYEAYLESNGTGNQSEQIVVHMDNGKLSEESLDDFAQHKYVFNEESIRYLNDHISTNAWIKYFLNIKFSGKGWVDFEAEIAKVLAAMDCFFEKIPDHVGTLLSASKSISLEVRSIAKCFLPLTADKFGNGFWGIINAQHVESSVLNKQRLYLLEILKDELDILIECLRLYLREFVGTIKCNGYSEQIKTLGDIYLLNFNYTNTFKNVYGNHYISHHSIHGDCQNGGMVLGVADDFCIDKLEYIYFVKYFQRIQKRTGNYYKEWIAKPSRGDLAFEDVPCEVYIMGHSLAETDKGVLEQFFSSGWVNKIVIYYHDQTAYESMVINLVRLFGKDYVIEQISIGRIVFEQLNGAVVGS